MSNVSPDFSRREFSKTLAFSLFGSILGFKRNNLFDSENKNLGLELPASLLDYLQGPFTPDSDDNYHLDGSEYNSRAESSNPKSTYCMPLSLSTYRVLMGQESGVSASFIRQIGLNSSWLVHREPGNVINIDGTQVSKFPYDAQLLQDKLNKNIPIMVVIRPYSQEQIGHWLTVVKNQEQYLIIHSAPRSLVVLKQVNGGGTYVTPCPNIEVVHGYLGRRLPSFLTYGSPLDCSIYILG